MIDQVHDGSFAGASESSARLKDVEIGSALDSWGIRADLSLEGISSVNPRWVTAAER